MKKKFILTLSLVISMAGTAFAAQNFDFTQNNYTLPVSNQTLKGSVVTVPAGESFHAIVTTPINSADITVGQNINLALGTDFYYNNNLIAPAGSSISGTAIEASKAKHGSLNGKLLIRFTQITTPYGIQIPISAVIKTNDNTGVLIGGTNLDVVKEYSKDVAIGASTGALAGLIVSPLAGGNVGKGTALSTAVGAGGGLVKSIWDKGCDVIIPANSGIELILTQPITVNPAIYNNY